MKLTIEFIEKSFHKFNNEYFEGKLITPRFEICKTKSFFGQFCYKGWHTYLIRISNYYDRTEKDFQNTIIHEMIHQYIRQNCITDTRPHHGRVFYSIADRINRQGGWHISRCSSDNEYVVTDNKKKTYHLAIFKLCQEGRYFIIKMNENKLSYFRNYILKYPDHFSDVLFFNSTDIKFDRMNECRTRIRGRYITKEQYLEYKEKENVWNRWF